MHKVVPAKYCRYYGTKLQVDRDVDKLSVQALTACDLQELAMRSPLGN
jgi:hypothetical protein